MAKKTDRRVAKKDLLKTDLTEKEAPRVEPELESDKVSAPAAKEIVKVVMADYKAGIEAMTDYIAQRELDLKMYYGSKPSEIENLKKKGWQSDRNLGVTAAVCDIYQATLLSTCWTPDTIHFIATEKNDMDNKANLTSFAKWAVSQSEGNIFPEVDDHIHNRTSQGFSVFKVYWKVWYEWVDRRIPNTKTGGYIIKTEKKRFEKGVMENISNVEDIVLPSYGKNIQNLAFFIHVIHKASDEVKDLIDDNRFRDVPDDFIDKLKGACVDAKNKSLAKTKANSLGISSITDADLRAFPLDLYEWYGTYKLKNKTEKYRFTIEPITQTLLDAKPVRRINRTNKIPFAGGAFIRIPGRIRGHSLPKLIAPAVNAINNVYNQKSDFQYITNCPFGFANFDEGYVTQKQELFPGMIYPVAGDPTKAVYFPNLQRSMAWAIQDINLLFEIIEKLTGAGSYFQTTGKNTSGTATRDIMVAEKGETKFSLWVKRIMTDVCEALTMFINMYQDWAPPNLGQRVLGEDGKQLIRNLSIESLRGNYAARMEADNLSGSKTLEKQVKMWAFENLQGSIWCNPQINPEGNYNLAADTIKILGINDAERYLGKKPDIKKGYDSKELEEEWTRFMQGEDFDPPEGEDAYQHMMGHFKQKEENYYDLDVEYRAVFDKHLFKTMINFRKLVNEIQKTKLVNTMMMSMMPESMAGRPLPEGQQGMQQQGSPMNPNIVQPPNAAAPNANDMGLGGMGGA